jgi:aminoacrylate hydrolase
VGFIEASDGCRLYVEEEGSGVPLLLIAGLGGSSEFWRSIGRLLSPTFRVICFDHRGAGRSDRPVQEYSVESIARDVTDILDHLGVKRSHIIGHSTGGAVAQILAIEAKDRVGKLVLSGTWDKADDRFRRLFAVRAAVLESCGPEIYQDLTHVLAYSPEWVNEHSEELNRACQTAAGKLDPVTVSLERIRMLCDFDRSAELGKIVAPTLVLGSVDDNIVPFYFSERIAKSIPGSRLVSFTGGHFFPTVYPQEFADVIVSFLSDADD